MDQEVGVKVATEQAIGPGPEAAGGGDVVVDFETRTVPHQALLDGKAEIANLQARYRPERRRRLKARALVIAGPSGAGKSTILESYAEDHPHLTDGPDGDVRRVILVEAPKRPTQRSFVAAIMRALGSKARDTWNTDEIIAKIGWLCDELKVELILIDEAHHLCEHISQDNEEDVSEFLKSLLNRLGTQIVLAGLPSLLHLRDYPQLRRRMQPPVVLHPYSWSSIEGRAAFMAMLGLFEAQLGLPEPSFLFEHETAKRLYCATGGYPGLVSKTLSEALSVALERKARRIDLTLLGQVWERFEPAGAPQLSVDPDARPVPARELARGTARNPYLAGKDAFLKLWVRMAREHATMSERANRRRPRQLAYRPVRDDVEERLAA
ncbi:MULTISPECIES: TniB family NTP-binding protein [Methylobacterium]|jgi:type II secretory pathway predicted ATPase ExeA|uniref:TniB family NTP-binding protein n=1 Tax=Methylobacterium TaxID=407 RepID=UPI00272EDDA0|nr:TniB family NTP-binding protein [Methylobacterium sp.]